MARQTASRDARLAELNLSEQVERLGWVQGALVAVLAGTAALGGGLSLQRPTRLTLAGPKLEYRAPQVLFPEVHSSWSRFRHGSSPRAAGRHPELKRAIRCVIDALKPGGRAIASSRACREMWP